MAQDGNDTWAIGNHGNTCSLSNCRPPLCWIVSITAAFSAPFLPPPTLSSLPLLLARVTRLSRENKRGSVHRSAFISLSASGQDLILVIDYKTRFALLLCPGQAPPSAPFLLKKVRLRRGKAWVPCDSSASTLSCV